MVKLRVHSRVLSSSGSVDHYAPYLDSLEPTTDQSSLSISPAVGHDILTLSVRVLGSLAGQFGLPKEAEKRRMFNAIELARVHGVSSTGLEKAGPPATISVKIRLDESLNPGFGDHSAANVPDYSALCLESSRVRGRRRCVGEEN
jgi:hypothetical protein